jgi:hypothetical protein
MVYWSILNHWLCRLSVIKEFILFCILVVLLLPPPDNVRFVYYRNVIVLHIGFCMMISMCPDLRTPGSQEIFWTIAISLLAQIFCFPRFPDSTCGWSFLCICIYQPHTHVIQHTEMPIYDHYSIVASCVQGNWSCNAITWITCCSSWNDRSS